MFFLNNPEIDFNLIGVADVLDMPGLRWITKPIFLRGFKRIFFCSDMLRKVVIEQVAAMMVLPNKFPIKLSDDVDAAELKAPEPKVIFIFHRWFFLFKFLCC